MAVKGSGTSPRKDNPDPAMIDQTHFDARGGAPKRTQTSFPIKETMKDQTQMSRVGPGLAGAGAEPNPAYHFGPDASSANPSDPSTKNPPRIQNSFDSCWGMKGGMGQDVEKDLGGKVLGEAILSGSTKLPAAVAEAGGAGPAYTGRDPN
jgi:hypothetical protein